MAWTAPATVVVGDTSSATTWNASIRDDLLFLFAPPTWRVRRTTDQALGAATFVDIVFDSERRDSDGVHPAGSSASFTLVTAGIYLLGAQMESDTSAAGATLALRISANAGAGVFGLGERDSRSRSDGGNDLITHSVVQTMGVGYIVTYSHWKTNAHNVKAVTSYSPEAWGVWVSAQ